FYIHSCQKMRYKGEYSPSYLADPEKYDWYPIEECKKLLDQNRYACFAHPEHSVQGSYDDEDPPPDLPSERDQSDIRLVGEISGGVLYTVPLKDYTELDSPMALAECINGLGMNVAKQIVLAV
ncbi:hypothetical protein HDZ31DRAFT_77573, partial [Schizophyllum fasciatum]